MSTVLTTEFGGRTAPSSVSGISLTRLHKINDRKDIKQPGSTNIIEKQRKFSMAALFGGVQLIDTFLSELDVFRISYPNTVTSLPLPTRVDVRAAVSDKHFDQTVGRLSVKISDLLEKNHLAKIDGIIAFWRWRHDESKKRRTLGIFTSDETGQERWPKAAKAIHELFAPTPFKDIHIEIMNPKLTYYKKILAQPPPDDTRTYFRKIRPSLLALLNQHMNDAWLDVGLYMCEWHHSQSIIIHVEENSWCDWKLAIMAIREVVGKEAIGKEIDVRVQPAQMVSLCPDDMQWSKDGHRHNGNFANTLSTGAGISTEDSTSGGGTIGVFVDLQVDKEGSSTVGLPSGIYRCAISAHHVVAPLYQHPSVVEAACKRGVSPLDNKDGALKQKIFYPATSDLRASVDGLSEKLKLEEREFKELLSLDWNSPDLVAASKSKIKLIKERLARCQQLSKMVEEREVGQTLASSGIKVSNSKGCHADEACHPECVEDHHLQDCAIILLSDKHSAALNIYKTPNPPITHTVVHLESPQAGRVVYKVWNKTGMTCGIVDEQRPHNRRNLFPNGIGDHATKSTSTWSKDWRVISETYEKPFSLPGDSGSGVINKRGSLVGQIHSGLDEGDRVCVTYMTAIKSVFEDLERLMPGCTISLPTPRRQSRGIEWAVPSFVRSWFG